MDEQAKRTLSRWEANRQRPTLEQQQAINRLSEAGNEIVDKGLPPVDDGPVSSPTLQWLGQQRAKLRSRRMTKAQAIASVPRWHRWRSELAAWWIGRRSK